jgi:nucleoside phosphorylase
MIATALYCEAKPFIDYYHLKKDMKLNKFQVFKNEEVLLVITGPGSISAAVAVTWLCTLHAPAVIDIFLNIGVCAAEDKNNPVGSAFLCNKITEQATKRSFYPDILFLHPFRENSVITCPVPWQAPDTIRTGDRQDGLADMEAAGLYQAASHYYKSHQMIFLKIVSDYGAGDRISPEKITELVKNNLPVVTVWLEQLKAIKQEYTTKQEYITKQEYTTKQEYMTKRENTAKQECITKQVHTTDQKCMTAQKYFTSEEEQWISELSSALFCSVTMEHQLRQGLLYYKLTHGSLMELAAEMEGQLRKQPCKTKLEGKKYFERLKEQLI